MIYSKIQTEQFEGGRHVSSDTRAGVPATRSRARTFTRAVASGVAVLLGLTGLIAAPVAANAAAGTVDSLGAVTVTQTGTAPLPAIDPSLTDNIVASGDTIKWNAPYTISAAGDYTLSATLPAGGRFTPATTSLCAAGSAISADGRTATCKLTATATGANNWVLEAIATGGNGATMAVTVQTGAFTQVSPNVTIVGAPKFGLDMSGASVNEKQIDSVSGFAYGFSVGVYAEVDPVYGLRGSEPLGASFSYTIDAARLPAGAIVSACGSATGNSHPKPVGTAANQVTNSGTAACSQPGGPGTDILVTVTGADTTATRYPTLSASNGAIPANKAYVSVTGVEIWVPIASLAPGTNVLSYAVKGFDPDSMTGQSNYGAGYAAGQAPGAADVGHQNILKYSLDNSVGGGWAGGSVYVIQPPAVSGQPAGWATSQAQTGPVYPGQPLTLNPRIINNSPTGAARENTDYCVAWSGDEYRLNGDVPSRSADGLSTTIRYGVLTGDAAAKLTNCMAATASSPSWYADRAAAEAAGVVTAVQIHFNDPIATRSSSYGTALIPVKRTETVFADGTVLPIATAHWSTGMPAPITNLNGMKGISTASQLKNTIAHETLTMAPASSQKITVTPSVGNQYAPAQSVTSPNTKIAVTMSDLVSVQTGSASAYMESKTPNANGTSTYVFNIGTIATGMTIPDLTFTINAATSVVMPETITISSEISSDSNSELASVRTATDTVYINAPQQFGFSQSASSVAAQPGDTVTFTLAAFNTKSLPVGATDIVNVLPENGDAAGTTGLTSLTLTGLTKTGNAKLYTTTATRAAVRTALDATPGANGVTWVEWTGGAVPANATAVKLSSPGIATGEVVSAEIAVKVAGTRGGKIVNAISSITAIDGVDQTRETQKKTVSFQSSSVTGAVYLDENYDGTFTLFDSGISGRTVTLAGYSFGNNGIDDAGAGDDVAVPAGTTQVTSAAGMYTFAGLHSGKYSVTVPALASQTSNGNVAAAAVVAVNADVTARNIGFVVTADLPVAKADTVVIPEQGTTAVDVIAGVPASGADQGANLSVDASYAPVVTGDITASVSAGKVALTSKHAWAPATQTSYTGAKARYQVKGILGKTSQADVNVTVQRAPVETAATTLPKAGSTQSVTLTPALLDSSTVSSAGMSVKTNPAAPATVVKSGSSFVFNANGGTAASYSFTVTYTDNLNQKTDVSYTVPVQGPPSGAGKALTAGVGQLATIAHGVTGTLATVAIEQAATKGFASVDKTHVTYLAGNTVGTDSFTVKYTNDTGESLTLSYTVTIAAKPSVSGVSTATVPMAGTKTFANTYTAGGSGAVTATLKTAPSAPSIVTFDTSVAGKPQAKFDAKTAAAGTYTFTVTYADALGNSVDQSYSVTVQAKPAASAKSVTIGVSQAVTIASGVTGTGVTGAVTTAPAVGTATVNASNQVTYTPTAAAGTYTFTVTYTDNLGQATPVVYTVTVQAKPTAAAKTAVVGVSKAVTIVSGVTGVGVTGTISVLPAAGNAAVDSSNNVVYNAPETPGKYTFDVKFTDSLGQTVTVTYTVTVQAAPVVSGVTSVRVAQSGVAVYDQITIETPGSVADAKVTTAPSAGVVSIDPATRTVSFTSDQTAPGDYTFSVTYTDDQGSKTVVPFTATVVEQFTVTPQMVYASAATGTKSLNPVISAGAVIVKRELVGMPPAAGTANIPTNTASAVSYTPANASAGLYSFIVRYTDDVGQTADAKFEITVLPKLTGSGTTVSVPYGTKNVVLDPIGATGSPHLLPLDVKNISAVKNGTVTITKNGTSQLVSWKVPAKYSGTTVITVTVTDKAGQTLKLVHTITVGAPAVTFGADCKMPSRQPVFADVALGQQFYKEIDWMQCTKLSTGSKQPSGRPLYMPKNGLTREAMAAFIYRLESPKGYVAPKISRFSDVFPGDPFYTEISWMYDAGLSTGIRQPSGAPMYKPKQLLTREAMAAFIYRLEAPKGYSVPAKSPFTDITENSRFSEEITWMYDTKLSTGNTVAGGKAYWPKANLSREATAAFIYRLVTNYRK